MYDGASTSVEIVDIRLHSARAVVAEEDVVRPDLVGPLRQRLLAQRDAVFSRLGCAAEGRGLPLTTIRQRGVSSIVFVDIFSEKKRDRDRDGDRDGNKQRNNYRQTEAQKSEFEYDIAIGGK